MKTKEITVDNGFWWALGCLLLIIALTQEIHARYRIDFSPYYQYDWWILNNRPMLNGFPVIGTLEE